MKRLILVISAVVIVVLASTAFCYRREISVQWTNEAARRTVAASLHKELMVGDASEKIERSLKAAGLGFTFDRFTNRYHASLRTNEQWNCGVWAVVEVDAQKRMKTVSVTSYYTGI